MDDILKKKVFDKIKEIYPKISNKDIIVLFGSRASGFALPNSDIDIKIFTKNYTDFKKVSYEKGLRNKGEDAGFDLGLDNGLALEVKFAQLKIAKFDVSFCYDILHAIPLTSKREFEKFRNQIKKEFEKNYEGLLFYSYVDFFNAFKNFEGLLKRNDEYSKINLYMKKGIVIKSLMRLAIIMNKKPYTFDKYLAHEAAKLKDWEKILGFIEKIKKIEASDDYVKVKVTLRDYLNSNMPKRDYVANWWKFLKRFKEMGGD